MFHWAYDTEPWNEELERLFVEHCEIYDLNIETNLRILKAKIVSEQKRRNKLIEKKTQEVFGFGEGVKRVAYTHIFSRLWHIIFIY